VNQYKGELLMPIKITPIDPMPMPKAKPNKFTKMVNKQKRDKAIADGELVPGDFNEMTEYNMSQFLKRASKVDNKMYGGKVKKMNMGGVVPGRGGSFKGVR
jgi:hypothetical protein